MRLENVNFNEILRDFSYESKSKKIGFVGPSGVGKTTLLRLLCGLEEAEGYIEKIDGSIVFQEARLIPCLNVKQNLSLTMGEEKANKWLKIMELKEDYNKFPKELSGGMRQRVALARALEDQRTLILDEPFQGLDPARKEIIKKFLVKREKIILVSHDIDSVVDLCQEVILLDGPPLKIKSIYKTSQRNLKEKLKEEFEHLIIKKQIQN